MPKKVLSIRLDDMLRDKLEFIAERECRTLANQITLFLLKEVNAYFSNESVSDAYLSVLRARVLAEQHTADNNSDDIPF